jgi:hypothetical protein
VAVPTKEHLVKAGARLAELLNADLIVATAMMLLISGSDGRTIKARNAFG